MTVTLEKVFFAYIFDNRRFYEIVEPYFFKNTEIQFVYNILKRYFKAAPEAETPHPRQILEMVQLEDRDGQITKEILKSILTVKLEEFDEENFILPKFNAWILSNRLKTATVDIIDETRNLDSLNEFDDVVESANKIKTIIDTMSKTDFVKDEDDYGSDFDNSEHHIQDNSKFKVKTGFESLDHILGGGWDVQTLNILMGMSNSGKSLWMQNLAIKSADMGYNVLYITLEMSEKKVMKRLGAMRLKIPVNEYDTYSKDSNLINKKISSLSKTNNSGLFDKKIGKIITKFWAAGTVQVTDFDNFIQKLKEKKGIKIDLLIVDYIALVAVPKSSGGDNLYTKGKYVAEALRALGAKCNVPVITAVQLAKDAWNSSDLTLESVPESKAIVETCDTFFGIIRTEDMRRQNLYRLKLLKQRDGDFLKSQIRIDLNPTYLTLENDQFID
jgi:replicative DNA helicase